MSDVGNFYGLEGATGVAMRQRLFGEKKPFVASLIHKNRETVTDRAHLAALAFSQMREGVARLAVAQKDVFSAPT